MHSLIAYLIVALPMLSQELLFPDPISILPRASAGCAGRLLGEFSRGKS
jgi:hypothetical protein